MLELKNNRTDRKVCCWFLEWKILKISTCLELDIWWLIQWFVPSNEQLSPISFHDSEICLNKRSPHNRICQRTVSRHSGVYEPALIFLKGPSIWQTWLGVDIFLSSTRGHLMPERIGTLTIEKRINSSRGDLKNLINNRGKPTVITIFFSVL
jgi:hypothetical protein